MSDLAVQVFMAESGITDFDVAKNVMYTYGLSEPYHKVAENLEPLLDDGSEAFSAGVEFAHELFRGIRFQMDASMKGSPFAEGIELAMRTVDGILQAAVDGAQMSDEDVELEARIRDASIFPLNTDRMTQIVSALFDNRREPSAR